MQQPCLHRASSTTPRATSFLRLSPPTIQPAHRLAAFSKRHRLPNGPQSLGRPRPGSQLPRSASFSAAPCRSHPAARAAPVSQQEDAAGGEGSIDVKLIGVGSRGAAALQRLLAHDSLASFGDDVWCLDTDKNVLDSVSFARGVLISKDSSGGGRVEDSNGGGPVSAEDLAAIVGRTASDAGGRGNIGSADGGVAFVLASAAAIAGGPTLLLQVVSALRAAGHFTVVAVTAPFAFEGPAKAEQARALVAALEAQAHLVAVTEQEVLLQAFGDSQLTVSEATDIADNALEHTARSVLQAVQAQELLKSSRGALMWHGRDMRHFKRLISPPLQQLLTCPGTAVLGRGQATLPAAAAHALGAVKALQHLASDAVAAAAESPFLDGALERATAVLCCINLPPASQPFAQASGVVAALEGRQSPEGEKRAVRAAGQAAAGALRTLTGGFCDEFVLCIEPLSAAGGKVEKKAKSSGNGSFSATSVQVEVTLLVLRAPDAVCAASGASAAAPVSSRREQLPAMVAGAVTRSTPPPPQPAAPPPLRKMQTRMSPSNWGLLSAMAGGAKGRRPAAAAAPSSSDAANSAEEAVTAAGTGAGPSQPPQQQQQQQQQAQRMGPPPTIKAPSFFTGKANSSGAAAGARPTPPTSVPQQQQQQPQRLQRGGTGIPPSPSSSQQAPPRRELRSSPAFSSSNQQQQQQLPQQQKPGQMGAGAPSAPARVTVGDYLADSLTAHSLDLPPAAAKWRQAQRVQQLRQRRLVVWEAEESGEEADEPEEEAGGLLTELLGRGKKKAPVKKNLKDRVAGMLAQDREDVWESEASMGE